MSLCQRWRKFRSLPIRGSWWGAAGLAAAVALYVIGVVAADVFVLRVSAIAFLVAALCFVCGTACVRVLAAPLILLFIAIPLPSALVTELTMPLQLAASHLAAGFLSASGFDVVRDGNILTLGYITLEVAEACSGMRSLVTLLALVAVYGATIGPPLRQVVALIAATLPVALLGNSLRVVATAFLASRMGEDATRGLVHDSTGFVAFGAMCAALAGVHLVVSRFGDWCAIGETRRPA